MKRYKTWQLVVLAKISSSFNGCLEMRVIDQAERKTIAIKGMTPQSIYFRLILLSKGSFESALLFSGALRESSCTSSRSCTFRFCVSCSLFT
jgi:predicted metal-binding protein